MNGWALYVRRFKVRNLWMQANGRLSVRNWTKRYGKQPALELAVDPELLGGVRIEVAGQVLDGTLRSGLRRMAGYLNLNP